MIQNHSSRFRGDSRTLSGSTLPILYLDKFYFLFLFGLNKETERWVKNEIFFSDSPLQSRSELEVFYLLEDMVNFDYHWHLSQHNAQQHMDSLEDQLQVLIELQKILLRIKVRLFKI